MHYLLLLYLSQGQTFIISPIEMSSFDKQANTYTESINRWITEGLQYEALNVVPTSFVREFVDKRDDAYPICYTPDCKLALLKQYKADYLCTFSILCIKEKCTINFLTYASYSNGNIEPKFSYRKDINNTIDDLKDEVENFVRMVAHKEKMKVRKIFNWVGAGLALVTVGLYFVPKIDWDPSNNKRQHIDTRAAMATTGSLAVLSFGLGFDW